MSRKGFVYILAEGYRSTLYIGVTSCLSRRIHEHQTKALPGFSQKYNTVFLVYYEAHDRFCDAIAREKRLKRWRRSWKIELIEQHNHLWEDLSNTL